MFNVKKNGECGGKLQRIAFIASIISMKNVFLSRHSTKFHKREFGDTNAHVRNLSILFRFSGSNILCFYNNFFKVILKGSIRQQYAGWNLIRQKLNWMLEQTEDECDKDVALIRF